MWAGTERGSNKFHEFNKYKNIISQENFYTALDSDVFDNKCGLFSKINDELYYIFSNKNKVYLCIKHISL